MNSKLAFVISELKAEMSSKQKDNKEIKIVSPWSKIYKRMLTTDILLLNGLINRSPKTQLKLLHTKYREAMGDWLELMEEHCDEGEYLEAANDCKSFNDRYDSLIKHLGTD